MIEIGPNLRDAIVYTAAVVAIVICAFLFYRWIKE
jgi:hypothetical protein